MTRYRALSDREEDRSLANYASWDEEKLGSYFQKQGLGMYAPVLKKHRITGRLAPLLSDDDLKEIGVEVVGDRLMFRHHLKSLCRQARLSKRVEALWEGEEQIFFSAWDRHCWTLCGICPVDPSTYKVTTNHIKVRRVQPVRCGPVLLCCYGATYRSNNIDLSKVDDVDVLGIPAPCVQRMCCCARGKDLVEVESRFEKGGKIMLTLEEGRGEAVANLILYQVEESQKIERS